MSQSTAAPTAEGFTYPDAIRATVRVILDMSDSKLNDIKRDELNDWHDLICKSTDAHLFSNKADLVDSLRRNARRIWDLSIEEGKVVSRKMGLVRWVDANRGAITVARVTIDKFKKELDNDPHYAMEWSDKVFKAAAVIRVRSQIDAQITEHLEKEWELGSEQSEPLRAVLQRLYDYYLKSVLRGAAGEESSTSNSSNYATRCALAVQAEIVDNLGYYLNA